MHICTKGQCPNRVSVGSQNDNDSVSFVCTNCNRLFYQSNDRLLVLIKWLKVFAALLIILLAWFVINKYSLFHADDHLQDKASKFLKAYYEAEDRKSYQDQIAMMDFDLEKFYETNYTSEEEVKQESKRNYDKVITSSNADFKEETLELIKVEADLYTEDLLDSIYSYRYSIDYQYEMKDSITELEIDLLVKLVLREEGLLKLKSIEETLRRVKNKSKVISEESEVTLEIEDTISLPKESETGISPEKPINDKSEIESIEDVQKSNDKQDEIAVNAPKKEFDCKSWNKDFGDPCYDKDSKTMGRINGECKCVGTKRTEPKIQQPQNSKETTLDYYLYADKDADGKGDQDTKTNDIKYQGKKNWVADNSDKCPERYGVASNGCPVLSLPVSPIIAKKGESLQLDYLEKSDYASFGVTGDKINWEAQAELNLINANGIKPAIRPSEYGAFDINLSIKGEDHFKENHYRRVFVQITKIELQELFNQAAELGRFDNNNTVPIGTQNKAKEAREKILKLASADCRVLENKIDKSNNLGAFIHADLMTKETYVRGVIVNDLQFDANCKIIRLDLSLKK